MYSIMTIENRTLNLLFYSIVSDRYNRLSIKSDYDKAAYQFRSANIGKRNYPFSGLNFSLYHNSNMAQWTKSVYKSGMDKNEAIKLRNTLIEQENTRKYIGARLTGLRTGIASKKMATFDVAFNIANFNKNKFTKKIKHILDVASDPNLSFDDTKINQLYTALAFPFGEKYLPANMGYGNYKLNNWLNVFRYIRNSNGILP